MLLCLLELINKQATKHLTPVRETRGLAGLLGTEWHLDDLNLEG
ncbi:hypothetical protein DFP90_106106 [Aestuariispira insulae]|uniref:Uncharacterized protein n=1 Tax=Aestuariispira insulae TaxID=1461337 RepID=A0A3D9HHY4_9PROT|nr:hypothetical protein DFP90_106106 [Aestuariispira insulae]